MNDDEQKVPVDYRYSLANERTFLAWVRTGLALVAGGVAVAEFATLKVSWIVTAVAVIALVLGAVLAMWAWWHWRRSQEAMERDEDLPQQPAVLLISVGVVVIAVLLIVGIEIL